MLSMADPDLELTERRGLYNQPCWPFFFLFSFIFAFLPRIGGWWDPKALPQISHWLPESRASCMMTIGSIARFYFCWLIILGHCLKWLQRFPTFSSSYSLRISVRQFCIKSLEFKGVLQSPERLAKVVSYHANVNPQLIKCTVHRDLLSLRRRKHL